MSSPYPAISQDIDNKVIVQAERHKIDLSSAEKLVEFYNKVGNTYGAAEPIMVLDVCQGLYNFHYENKVEGLIIKFLSHHLWNIGYLEDADSWNEFSEIMANSNILEDLQ
jgi:hypothetical protein